MRYLLILATAICVLSCKDSVTKTSITTTEKIETPGKDGYFDVKGMDTVVSPGNNFYTYANGTWDKMAVIPDDLSGYGSFMSVHENNQLKLKGLVEEAAASNAAKGTLEQKVGDYYLAGMDTNAIEKKDWEPVKAALAKIDAVKDYNELMNTEAKMNAAGQGHFLLGFNVDADEKNSGKYISILSQSGLSLPENGYYTRTDSATKAARDAMVTYAKQLFEFTGTDAVTAEKNAKTILALETEMAKSHRSPVELRDPQKNYNKMSFADIVKSQPNINWPVFFSELKAKPDSVNMQQPGYYSALNKMLASRPIEEWKLKAKFYYLANSAQLLSKKFRDASFAFNKIFSGQKVDRERWKKMIQRIDGSLGELAGQLYVKKYFTEDAKKKVDELVNNLQAAFAKRMEGYDWMSDSTKKKAATKMNGFLKKIGYPSKWKTYDDVVIDKNDFFGDAENVRKHNLMERVARIGKETDRTLWDMSPPTVNAYYNPTNNEIVFPAGILQFPFFDAGADDAINYGGIGAVIGHEMTHAFDDQGSQYDEKGNMHNWWTKEDLAKFKAKTAQVVKQYDAYTLFGNVHVNGSLTQGENIADIGGLAIAYDAFKMTKQGKSNEMIQGFNPDQRFFLGFAQIWRWKDREENMRTRLLTDPHSPEMFRINGPLSNFDPFYSAFHIKETDSMFIPKEKRIRIW